MDELDHDRPSVAASFRGMHMAGVRVLDGEVIEGLTEPVTFEGKTLVDSLAVYGAQAEVTLRWTGKTLMVSDGKATVRIRPTSSREPWSPPTSKSDTAVSLVQTGLKEKLNILEGTAATSLDNQILMGVHLQYLKKQGIILRATNGFSATVCRHAVSSATRGVLNIVVVPKDLRLAMAEVGREVDLFSYNGKLGVSDEYTYIEMSGLVGNYPPSFGRLATRYDRSFPIHAEMAANLARASKTLDAPLATIALADHQVTLSLESGKGEYTQNIGEVGTGGGFEDFSLQFPAQAMAAAIRAAGKGAVPVDIGETTLHLKGEDWHQWHQAIVSM